MHLEFACQFGSLGNHQVRLVKEIRTQFPGGRRRGEILAQPVQFFERVFRLSGAGSLPGCLREK